MPKQNLFNNITTLDVMCASIEVYKSQGFIKSGHGYTDNKDPENPIKIDDNKTMIMSLLKSKELGIVKFPTETVEEANNLINSINGKLMLKKMTTSKAQLIMLISIMLLKQKWINLLSCLSLLWRE